MYEKRYAVLRCAAKRLLAKPGADYRRFVKENDFWLPDYALFMALKDAHNGVCWLEWEEPLRRREPAALAAARQQYADDVAFWQAVQFMFYSQWQALKHYANQQEIRIIGDLPIYVALDSVDVWSCPQEFQLDENLLPTEVAGCPPDGFSATGQLWGNPLFDWDSMAKTGYAWWVRRIKHMCSIYDVVRIDHFRICGLLCYPLRGSNRPERPLARRSRLCAVCCHKEKAGQPAHHRRGFGIPDGRCHCPAEAMRLSRHESAGVCL
jgi:4-alpha-glucanotransferase